MKSLFDRVIVSSDTNPKFIQFWPIIQAVWPALFRVPVTLALVVDEADRTAVGLPGDVLVLPVVPDIPKANQAKMARYYAAAMHGWSREVISTNDIDLLPLQTAYLTDLLAKRPEDHLFTLGTELYRGTEAGKFTAGYLTAERGVWERLVNPGRLPWDAFVRSFAGHCVLDHKEDIARDVFHEDPDTFSDESLLRARLHVTGLPAYHAPRGYGVYTDRAVCRSAWNINPAKLADGTYVEAHLLRPWCQHRDAIQPLLNHLGLGHLKP